MLKLVILVLIALKKHIETMSIKVNWKAQSSEITPVHVAIHFAPDSKRDSLIRLYLEIFPELLPELNTPKDLPRHIALWAITNAHTTDQKRIQETLILLRKLKVKMAKQSADLNNIFHKVIEWGCRESNGILTNIRQKTFHVPVLVKIDDETKQAYSAEDELFHYIK